MLHSSPSCNSVLKALIVFIASTQINCLYAQLDRAGGGFFDSSFLQMQMKAEFPVTRDALPEFYSLKVFAPPAGDQGSIASCYSWATAYAGMTMVKRIEKGSDSIRPFSAMNLFNRLKTKNQEPVCSYGSFGYENLNLLRDYGCPHYDDGEQGCMTSDASLEFPDKLYHWQLLRVNEHTIKSALLHHQPVVFLIKQYEEKTWEKVTSENTQWNGITRGTPVQYHAMCVVGYDNSVNGGSYEVLNSWGESFGNGGYFWIRYSDFERETVEAFSLIPQVDNAFKVLDNAQKSLNSTTVKEKFSMTNSCDEWAYVAIGHKQQGTLVTKGWYAIAPKNSIEIDITQRQENTFFWYASTRNQRLEWKGEESSTNAPIQLNNSFQSMENREDSTEVLKPFIEANPIGSEIYTQTLLCPTKYSENVKVALHYSSLQSGNDKKFNNQYWTSAYPLFDYYTEEYIETASGSLVSIWVTNGKKRPKQKTMTVEELEKCNLLKFSSEENALKWLETNQ
jgi:uncharacterized membrane protein